MLTLTPGKKVYYRNLPYNGEVKVNVAGWWRQGLNEPLGVVPNLEPQATLSIYQRMKIEESLRHLMSLWGLGKVMDKRRDCREKVTALVMLAYSLGTPGRRSAKRPGLRGKGAGGFFGLFLLLKKARQVSMEIVREAARRVTPPYSSGSSCLSHLMTEGQGLTLTALAHVVIITVTPDDPHIV